MGKQRPLILVTNDDGVYAKGIQELMQFLRELGDVVVVAPDSARSGMSKAITVNVPIRVREIDSEPGLKVYKCTGTPVDCVKLAMNQILDRKPDLVVSGINHGTNTSISVLYSGTMGAAIEGCILGIPSIGASLTDFDPDADFSQAVRIVRFVAQEVLEHGLDEGVCLNLNIPGGLEVKGVQVCRQAHGVWVEDFEKRMDPHKRNYYWLTGYFKNFEPESTDTDEAVLAEGYASVVPCHIDLTAYRAMSSLKRLNHEGKI